VSDAWTSAQLAIQQRDDIHADPVMRSDSTSHHAHDAADALEAFGLLPLPAEKGFETQVGMSCGFGHRWNSRRTE
jgi:hypothetical protein